MSIRTLKQCWEPSPFEHIPPEGGHLRLVGTRSWHTFKVVNWNKPEIRLTVDFSQFDEKMNVKRSLEPGRNIPRLWEIGRVESSRTVRIRKQSVL